MFKKIIFLLIILTTYSFICSKIYLYYKPHNKKNTPNTPVENLSQENYPPIQEITYSTINDNSIGKIKIDKINLNKKLYPINDKKNNIEENVTILKYSEDPAIENSIMFIAAHSGTGPLAFFKHLNKLQKDDLIELTYQNIKYTYKVKNSWEIPKTGAISVNKENINQLILTTCSPTHDDRQLIINSILTKKES